MTETVLAFDYGTQNIGVAVGQTLTGSARELRVIKAKDGIPNWEHIQQSLDEWQPDRVLVGLPLNMDDSASELSVRAKKFANRLHGRFGVKVTLVDERLSTREAKELAHTKGHKGNFKQQPVDAIAARLILETWLRSNKTIK